MYWRAGWQHVLGRITAALISLTVALQLLYAVPSPANRGYFDLFALVVGWSLVALTLGAFFLLEFKSKMVVVPLAGAPPNVLQVFDTLLNERYKSLRVESSPSRYVYLFSPGERQFYYHMSGDIIAKDSLQVRRTIE